MHTQLGGKVILHEYVHEPLDTTDEKMTFAIQLYMPHKVLKYTCKCRLDYAQ